MTWQLRSALNLYTACNESSLLSLFVLIAIEIALCQKRIPRLLVLPLYRIRLHARYSSRNDPVVGIVEGWELDSYCPSIPSAGCMFDVTFFPKVSEFNLESVHSARLGSDVVPV